MDLREEAAKWKTCLSAIVDGRNRMVNVSYEPAPPNYGFLEYNVSLNSGTQNVSQNRTNATSVTFTGIKNGTYDIIVFPNDTNSSCARRCSRLISQIKMDTSSNNLLNVTVCGNITGQTVIERPEITNPPIVINWKYYLLFTPLLFVIMALIIYKWKRQHITGKDLNSTVSTTRTTTSTGKIKVFIIYVEDHTLHTEACRSFIHYLNEHCFCDVLNTYPEYSSVPVYDMEKYADYVLVINSQAFYSGFCAWKCRETCPTMESDFYLEIFEKILQNVEQSPTPGSCEYLMCAMDYMDEKYLPLEFSRCELFKIVGNMTALVCHIQKLDLSSANEGDVPRISEHMGSSPDGDSLISAIENAEYFEKTHPNWFQEKSTHAFYSKENFPLLYKNDSLSMV